VLQQTKANKQPVWLNNSTVYASYRAKTAGRVEKLTYNLLFLAQFCEATCTQE